jgi:tRNA-splicing ligase RtcB
MGQAITRQHLANSTCDGRLAHLDSGSDAGRNYLADVDWARVYARESRLAMLRAVEGLLLRMVDVQMQWNTLIHSDHNHVSQEHHFGEMLWVHRKGAQQAGDGGLAIIPGSMGTPSFHVVGRGAVRSLCSCSHGAGRELSRSEARRNVTTRELLRQMHQVWFDHRRASALREEAPSAYKDIRRVMKTQKELVSVVRELRPLLSYKGA